MQKMRQSQTDSTAKTVGVWTRLSPAELKKLRAIAQREDRSVAGMIRLIVKEKLRKLRSVA